MVDNPKDKYGRPRVFLEGNDVPVAEIGIECQRERGTGQQPPDKRLHVWWARRPLTVSRAAVLGSLLPVSFERKDFLELMGVPNDSNPLQDRKRIDHANKVGEKLKVGFSYNRAFTNKVPERAMNNMHNITNDLWGGDVTVLDSFAGGGSIPFEAYRMGFNVILNELNPVATVLEKAIIEYPSLFGKELEKDIKHWGDKIAKEIEMELEDCFPKKNGEEIFGYIWVRTIKCPRCELEVPLSPNWWLDKNGKLGYKLVVPERGDICRFEMKKQSSDFNPDEGTVTRGIGRCPRCSEIIEGDEIKRQAQAGNMGHQMAAIGYKMKGKSGRHFREVTDEDLEGYRKAEKILKERLPAWEARGLVPNEVRSINYRMDTVYQYGFDRWSDAFSKRQLLVHLITLENINNHFSDGLSDREIAIKIYLLFMLNKGLNFNSLQSRHRPTYGGQITGTFDRHDFAFKFSYGEIDGSGQLFRWGVDQIVNSYKGISNLINQNKKHNHFQLINGDSSSIIKIKDESISTIIIDPPYYDNVQYADLSDFFYVWLKRGLLNVFPYLFNKELTDKEKEAIANYTRFLNIGKGKARKLSETDYNAKMASSFKELNRILTINGVFVVMFTHKKTEAWDILSRALLDAGFEITASWPIHTENQKALNQAKKNAAASTILLVCRKRPENAGTGWWEDLKPVLERRVMEQAEKFEANGIRRLDLSIACFGTALEVISEKWPVKKGDGAVISPDEALDAAREVVAQWFMDKITEGGKKEVDPATQFYILAWYVFQARTFPYDEARKLSISVGYSIDDLISRKILKKKGSNVELLTPKDRARAGGIKPEKDHFTWDIDYVHGAIISYETEGAKGLERFHINTGALERQSYRNTISYLLDVLPRTKEVMEYGSLNSMWEGNLQDKISRRKRQVQDPTSYEQMKIDELE